MKINLMERGLKTKTVRSTPFCGRVRPAVMGIRPLRQSRVLVCSTCISLSGKKRNSAGVFFIIRGLYWLSGCLRILVPGVERNNTYAYVGRGLVDRTLWQNGDQQFEAQDLSFSALRVSLILVNVSKRGGHRQPGHTCIQRPVQRTIAAKSPYARQA